MDHFDEDCEDPLLDLIIADHLLNDPDDEWFEDEWFGNERLNGDDHQDDRIKITPVAVVILLVVIALWILLSS